MGTSTCLYNQEMHRHWSISFFYSPFLYFLSLPCWFFSHPLLADRPVNDGPHSSSELWVDACLCDSCGVLSKTKGAWQAAAPRLDQTGLVYWSSPLCSGLLRSRLQLQCEESARSAHHCSKMGTTRTTHKVFFTPTKENKKG